MNAVNTPRASPTVQPHSSSRQSRSRTQSKSHSKRSKYAPSACDFCQKRKLKCDSESPCKHCQARQLRCARSNPKQSVRRAANRENGVALAESLADSCSDLLDPSSDHQPFAPSATAGPDLVVEEILGPPTRRAHRAPEPPGPAANALGNDYIDQHRRTPSPSLHEAETDVDATSANYARTLGETSIDLTLQQAELDLDVHPPSLQSSRLATAAQDGSLIMNRKHSGTSAPLSTRLRMMRLLQRHDLVADENEWDELFSNFCEYVYPLFPFFHLPSLEATYSAIWALLQRQFYERADTPAPSADELAQVLICLALGRCTHSARTSAFEGFLSSGWKFYTAAAESVGSLFDPTCDAGATIERLQTLTCMTWYLIRLDAFELAHKIVGLAVQQAHTLGLHRESVVENLSVFRSELARRVWHTIYVLDRRLALDIGRPFLIHDYNVDTDLPHDLRTDWLERQSTSEQPMRTMRDALKAAQSAETTPIGYLRVMVGYSHLVGKIWDAVNDAEATSKFGHNTHLTELETRLLAWASTLPSRLACDVERLREVEQGDQPWQSRQRILILVRIKWLRILMLRPLRPRKDSRCWMTDGDTSATAISLAGSIIDIFAQVLDSHQLYHFPFVHYLTGATSIILGIVARKPFFRQHYGQLVASAIGMIQTFCQKTWVSGKTARTVQRLRTLAGKVFDTRMDIEPGVALANSVLPTPESSESSTGNVTDGGVRLAEGGSSGATNPRSQSQFDGSYSQQIHQQNRDALGQRRSWKEQSALGSQGPQDAASSFLPDLESTSKTYQRFDERDNNMPLVVSDFAFEVDIGTTFDQNIASWDQTLQPMNWTLNAAHGTPSDFLSDAIFDFNTA